VEIRIFCPRWGAEHLGYREFCRQVKDAGYDGVESDLPTGDQTQTDAFLEAMADNGLAFIGDHHQSSARNLEEHRKQLREHLEWLVAAKPLFINSQTGRDWFTLDDNLSLIGTAHQLSEQTGMTILHETHRGKFSFCAASTKAAMDRDPRLRLSADFSHWCVVSESLLEDQDQALEAAIRRTHHIHARVGFPEGPQVTDPRSPQAKAALDAHLSWWDRCIEARKADGLQTFTITPEFGPAPYMAVLPWTGMPVADQWEINRHMMNMLRERYT